VEEIRGDAVAFGFGLSSETQLADLAGCSFHFDRTSRQWLPAMDEDGRAKGAAGVYLAGDGAGIAGADAAELAGVRAALALLADRGIAVSAARRARITRRLSRWQRFRRGIGKAFPFPVHLARCLADETILCRCEAVTAGELRAAVVGIDADELNRAKAFSRVGMGRCQGRVCGPAAAELLAAKLGADIAAVGRLRRQPPVKPLVVGCL
jgi:NADPH-dependent 2,4-dienoyl-CoA reductase/sulfur reductase-like enzyme